MKATIKGVLVEDISVSELRELLGKKEDDNREHSAPAKTAPQYRGLIKQVRRPRRRINADKRWSLSERKEILRLHKAGYKHSQIGKRCGRSSRAITSQIYLILHKQI